MKERTKRYVAFSVILLLGFTIGIMYQSTKDSWCVNMGFAYLDYKNISLLEDGVSIRDEAYKFIDYIENLRLKGGG